MPVDRVLNKEELLKLAETGMTKLETSKILNVGESTIIYYARKYKISFKRERVSKKDCKNKPTKDELYQLYIIQNLTSSQIAKIYDTKVKTVQGWCEVAKLRKDKKIIGQNKHEGLLRAHNGKHPMHIESYKKLINTPESLAKAKETCIKKYGYKAFVAIPEIHTKSYSIEARLKGMQTCIEKYGVSFPVEIQGVSEKGNSPESRIKAHKTKKENNSYTQSKEEELVYKILCSRFDTVLRQYSDDRYPFPCDFYIPTEDLFIEYNGYFTHGKAPFDKNNSEHIAFVNYWREQAQRNPKGHGYHVLRTFVKNDPLKRQLVKKRKLNWKEFFTIEDVEVYFGAK